MFSKFRDAPLIYLPCRTRLRNSRENKRKSLRVSSFTSDLAENVDYPANNGNDLAWIW